MTKKSMMRAALLGATLAGLAAGQPVVAQQGLIIERVLVRVNGEILTQTQLTQKQIMALRERNQNVADQRALQDDAKLSAEIAELTPRLLVQAVDELLLIQRGRELKVQFTEELFRQGLENLKKQNNFKSDEDLTAALEKEGITLAQLRQDFERSYMIQAVQQREIGQRMNLTEEERRQFYNTHREMFLAPATITLREVFIPFPTEVKAGQNVSAAEEAAVRERIEAVRARAVAGEDFAALVTEVSQSTTKANGGLVGPVRVEDINPALADSIKALEPGQVSTPVRSPRGYQIFKLEARSEAAPRPYEDVRTDIQQRIFEDRVDVETQKLLERLRTQAVIEWKDDTYRRLYASALGGAVSQ